MSDLNGKTITSTMRLEFPSNDNLVDVVMEMYSRGLLMQYNEAKSRLVMGGDPDRIEDVRISTLADLNFPEDGVEDILTYIEERDWTPEEIRNICECIYLYTYENDMNPKL